MERGLTVCCPVRVLELSKPVKALAWGYIPHTPPERDCLAPAFRGGGVSLLASPRSKVSKGLQTGDHTLSGTPTQTPSWAGGTSSQTVLEGSFCFSVRLGGEPGLLPGKTIDIDFITAQLHSRSVEF